MPTVDEWVAALTVPRTVNLRSDVNLVASVNQQQVDRNTARRAAGRPTLPAKTATLVPLAAPTIEVTPIDLLHAIGLATTPPIPNLASLSATWAMLRYIWAFEIPVGSRICPLKLATTARAIDFHQKGLLSDEVGVGMGCLLMSRLFGATSSVDVSVAVNDPHWGANLASALSPDFICFDPAQQAVVVLECKGNQTSASATVAQLGRGIEQLPSLQFNNRQPPPAYVVATHLGKSATTVYLVDPPGDNSPQPPLAGSPSDSKAMRTSTKSWRIIDDERFFRELQDLEGAKLATFSGDDALAATKLPMDLPGRDDGIRPSSTPSQAETLQGQQFSGVVTQGRTREGNPIRIFKGLSDERRDEIRDGSGAPLRSRQVRTRRDEFTMEIHDTPNAVVVDSLSPEDTLLRFSIAK